MPGLETDLRPVKVNAGISLMPVLSTDLGTEILDPASEIYRVSNGKGAM